MTDTRREIAAEAFGAIALGIVAAALPSLFGLPVAERPDLRGLAAATLGALATGTLTVRLGWRYGRSETPVARGVLLALARVVAVAVLVATPSYLAGVSALELDELVGEGQRAAGWSSSFRWLSLGVYGIAGAWAISCLISVLRQGGLRPGKWELATIAAGALAIGLGIAGLISIPAPVGAERAIRLAGLGIFATLAAAALTAGWRRALKAKPALVLAAGFATFGLATVAFALAYRSPSVRSIVKPRIASESEDWTLVESELRGRPDLRGYFALPKRGGKPRLVSIAPSGWSASTPPFLKPVDEGWVYRPPTRLRSEADPAGLTVASPETLVELRLLSHRFSQLDRRTGLAVPAQSSFQVSPGTSFVVASYRDPERPVASQCPSPSLLLALIERGSKAPTIIARGLWEPPLVLRITNDEVRFLFVGDRSPSLVPELRDPTVAAVDRGPRVDRSILTTSCAAPSYRVSAATFRVQERIWSDQKQAAYGVGTPRSLFPDRRRAIGNCHPTWCVFDTDDLANPVFLESPAPRANGFPLPLSNGRVAMKWYETPTILGLHWRLSLYEVGGKVLRTMELEGSAAVQLAGELEDGSIVIARHAGRSYGPGADEFGWRVEAIDQETFTSRILASSLKLLTIGAGDSSSIFLDRNGRMLSPSISGMVNRLENHRRFDSSRASTGQVARVIENRP